MSESNPAEPCSTMDSPIDPVTHEPLAPADHIPVVEPVAPTPAPGRIEILLMQQNAELKDDECGWRAILVKSTQRDVAALELFFQSTKPEAQAACLALSKLKSVVGRTGPVGWSV